MGNTGASKADWLEAGLSRLRAKGIDRVKVDLLAKDLGIARSGFYWHFRNRADFLDQLLEHWIHETTTVVLNNPQISEGTPDERLLKIVQMIKKFELNRHDTAILSWAGMDARAREVFDGAIDRRVQFVRSIFQDLGFTGDDLESRARIFVTYVSWENHLFPNVSKRKRNQWLKMQIELLTRK
jgi:AcrR family transcriptional regulator